ncbi:MAG: hypothetical protein JWM02_1291 [Frankiales bacterium]|nr:hypothetical protein [Frankiales bacterium]
MTADVRNADAAARPALRYWLPAVDGAVWLGLRPAALITLAVTATLAVTLLMSGVPVAAAVAVLVVGGVVAALPVAGRSPLAWAPVLLRHLRARLSGADAWTVELTDHPTSDSPARTQGAGCSASRLDLPREYGPLQLLGLYAGDRDGFHAAVDSRNAPDLGAVSHASTRTVSVVFDVIGTDRFALVAPDGQDSQLARWGTCLSALAADPQVLRIQWLTHTRPDSTEHASQHHDGPDAGLDRAPGHSERADVEELQADYRDLADTAARNAWTHQHLLVLTVLADPALPTRPTLKAGGRGSRTGRSPGRAARGTVAVAGLVEHARDLAATLLAADLLPRALSAAELGAALRHLQDPTLPGGAEVPDDPRRWAISSRHSQWDCCRTDDAWHRSFAITGWPRLALPADWLAPLLHTPPPDGTSRTLAVHAVPVAPQHAARQARASRAKARLDAADRNRMGFTSHSSDALAEHAAAELETELIAGYRLTHLTAFLTISAPDPDRLQAATLALRTLSVSHRLDLRPLHGQHPRGLVACLPLGLAAAGGPS